MKAPAVEASLLIVDDRVEIQRGLSRFFRAFIESVRTATTPDEAEQALREQEPQLLLCDYWLGPEHPPGTVLIERWRREHPCILRAALMTGTKATAILPTHGVDHIFQKPLDLHEVKDWLLEGLSG